MFNVVGYAGKNDGKHIKTHEAQTAKFQNVQSLHDSPEKVQRYHVE